MKSALITGISGQDGSYLGELLLSRGYTVHGVVRHSALRAFEKNQNVKNLNGRIVLHSFGNQTIDEVLRVFQDVQPNEIYHLASTSFVSYELADESEFFTSTVSLTHAILIAIKTICPDSRFYLAGSSEMFGHVCVSPQDERTPFNPRSLYGISKLASFHLTRNFRQRYNLFACTGILYNHESTRRGLEFVTRKITSTVARISVGLADSIELGNVDAYRDWGYAPEYVDAMCSMLQLGRPEDFVIATGKLHSVREVLEIAFGYLDLDYTKYLKINPLYFRPSENVSLCGNASKANISLGWKASKSLKEIIEEMVTHDILLLNLKKST